jgi:hypothetical protein
MDNWSVYYSRGEQIPGATSIRRLKFVRRRLIFVGPQWDIASRHLPTSLILRGLLDFWNICATVYIPFCVLFERLTDLDTKTYQLLILYSRYNWTAQAAEWAQFNSRQRKRPLVVMASRSAVGPTHSPTQLVTRGCETVFRTHLYVMPRHLFRSLSLRHTILTKFIKPQPILLKLVLILEVQTMSHSYSKTNKMHQFPKLFIFAWHSTCFGRSFRPSSGVQRERDGTRSISFPLASRQQYLFDICLLLYVQSWTPDDGRKDRPKHVQCHAKINNLGNWCIWLILL